MQRLTQRITHAVTLVVASMLGLASFMSSKAQTSGYIYTYAGSGTQGYVNGAASSAQFFYPGPLSLDSSGNLYVGDRDNYSVRKISSAGAVSTYAGNGRIGVPSYGVQATSTSLSQLQAVAADPFGNVYIIDTGTTVDVVNTAGILTVSFTPPDGTSPRSIATDSAGNLYVGTGSHIYERLTSGTVLTLAGTGYGCQVGGTAATSQIGDVEGLAVDASGNIYFSDSACYTVYEITTNGGIVKIAGTGTRGFSGDGGAAIFAQIGTVHQIAIDSSDNIYITDFNPNERIRKVAAGTITTIAGTGSAGYNGDGIPATSANLTTADGVAVDTNGNVYLGDEGSNRVRKISR